MSRVIRWGLVGFFIHGVLGSPAIGEAADTSRLSKTGQIRIEGDKIILREKIDAVFENIDKTAINTGILYDKVIPFSNIEQYDGSAEAAAASLRTWKQMALEMHNGAVDKAALPPIQAIQEKARPYIKEGVTPIAILDIRYDKIRKDAVTKGLLELREGKFYDVAGRSESPYDTKQVFAAAAFREHGYDKEITFLIDKSFYFTNHSDSLGTLEIDFDDGQGYRKVQWGEQITVRYTTAGQKSIRVKLTQNNSTRYASFNYNMKTESLSCDENTETWSNQTAHYQWGGLYAHYDVTFHKGTNNNTIDKPIIVVEGFDPTNSLSAEDAYNEMNQTGYAEELRCNGNYDIAVLNFADGADYIERNAMALVSLIEDIINVRDGNTELIVVGASMGGLISRYALLYMENHGLDHDTKLFVSFDSPQQAANIPLGIQYWIAFFSEYDASAQEGYATLYTPAAKQMLEPHMGVLEGEISNLNEGLQSELEDMGDYPQNTRLRQIAISNGSGFGQAQTDATGGLTLDPSDQILYYHYSGNPEWYYYLKIIGDAFAIGTEDLQRIFIGKLIINGITVVKNIVDDISGYQPFDGAPGGWRDTAGYIAAQDVPYGDVVTLFPYHCFIPTVSALDIGEDLFYNVSADSSAVDKSPFDAIFYADSNEEHVTITDDNEAFINEQIAYVDAYDTDGDGFTDTQEVEMGLDPLTPSNPMSAIIAFLLDSDSDADGYDATQDGGDDCDDWNANIHPGAEDIPDDGIDQDCDGKDLSSADLDQDGDGLSNGQELALGTNPNDADSDDDGLSDGDEVNTHGTNPLNTDSDGDGFTDTQEVEMGLDPLTPSNPMSAIIAFLLDSDNDADGYDAAQDGGDDCDDWSADIHPGAEDIPDDGIDQDCDGADLDSATLDQDKDGYTPNDGDCDDSDATVNPSEQEIEDDEIDNNCDGTVDENVTCSGSETQAELEKQLRTVLQSSSLISPELSNAVLALVKRHYALGSLDLEEGLLFLENWEEVLGGSGEAAVGGLLSDTAVWLHALNAEDSSAELVSVVQFLKKQAAHNPSLTAFLTACEEFLTGKNLEQGIYIFGNQLK